jgi:hypothetical protein
MKKNFTLFIITLLILVFTGFSSAGKVKVNKKIYKGPFIINTEVLKKHAHLYSSWSKEYEVEKNVLSIGMERFKYVRKRGPRRFRFQSLY